MYSIKVDPQDEVFPLKVGQPSFVDVCFTLLSRAHRHPIRSRGEPAVKLLP